MKSGIKTSEFWLSTAAIVLGALLAAGVFGADNTTVAKIAGAALAALAALGYTGARTQAKKAAAQEKVSLAQLDAQVEVAKSQVEG